MELEDAAILGDLLGMVQVDTIDQPNEQEPERERARERSEHVAQERDALLAVELGRGDLVLAGRAR